MKENTTSSDAHLPLRRVDQGATPTEVSTHRHEALKPKSAAPQQFTPKFLWWVFTRHWKAIVPVGLILAAAASSALLYSYEPLYRASGLIKIEENQPYIAFQQGAIGSNNSKFIHTQIEMMRSPAVLRTVLGDENVGAAEHLLDVSDRLKHLQEGIEVHQVGGSELYTVSYAAPSAQEASDVVVAVIRHYFVRQSDDGDRRAERVVDLLEQQRVNRKLEVERLQERVIGLSREVTGKDPFGHNLMTDVETAISPLASLHQQLTDIEVRIEILRAELQSLEEAKVVQTPHADRTGVIDLEVAMDANVRQQEAVIGQISSQMREIQRVHKQWRKNNNYRLLAEQLEGTKAGLADYKAKLKRKLLVTHVPGMRQGENPADVKRRALASLEVQERSLRKRFDKELGDVQESGGKGAELEFAKAELAREEKVFEMIAARKLALRTEAKAPARVEVMDEVRASSTPVETAPWKKLFLACAVAMAAPFGVAVLRELTLRRVTDAEQLYEDTRLRVLGEIATFPTRRVAANPRQLPRKLRKEMFAFAESIDSLRMSLMFAAPSEKQRVVAVTSAVSGEGKTSVSVALAMSFANATGERTLLIDGDMRDPSVDELIDLPDGPGLCDVLSAERKLEEAIKPAAGTNHLFVLRAGHCNGSPHHFTQPQRLESLIAAVRTKFKTIVIDTPPVLGASEAISLCRTADLTAVCTLRGVSRMRQVKLAAEKLETSGSRIAGSVLSGIPTRGHGYAYAYGYGYQDGEPDQIGKNGDSQT